MQKLVLENLDCTSCANKIEKALCAMSSVKNATINFNTSTLYIQTDDLELAKSKIIEVEPNIKFVDSFSKTKDSISNAKEIILLCSLVIAFGLSMLILHYKTLESILSLIELDFLGKSLFNVIAYTILAFVYCISGMPIFKAVISNTKNKVFFDENSLMFIATIAALCIGEISEAVAVMLFFRIGEFLESAAVKKSKKSLYSLLDITPEIAHVKQKQDNIKGNDEIIWHDTHPELLNIDDIMLVKVGEKIPTDGIILQGTSHLNTQSLSGESKPIFVKEGDFVLAGAINIENILQVVVSKKFEDSQISKIKTMVEEASNTKAKTQKLITRFAKVYTPLVFFIALVIACIPPLFVGDLHEWIYRSLVVLMVSCPCALVLSVPLGYFGAIGIASKKGILVKGSQHFETLASLKNIIFDKTGTLTQGVFKIIDIIPINNSKNELLQTAIHAQRFSNHPIAKSIIQGAKNIDYKCQAEEFKEISGKGVFARCCNENILVGNISLMQDFNINIDLFYSYPHNKEMLEANSIVHVAKNGLYMGYIIMGDSIKEDSEKAINNLNNLGITPLAILSGDNEASVSIVANKLGIKKYYANLLPTQKVEKLQDLMKANTGKSKHNKSAFVGDGINDSIVLSKADVGISIGTKDSNNDLSKENADIILTNPSLMGVVNAIKIAKKIQKITWENISFALGTKLILVILGIIGIANMWLAVFGDVGVALIALLNALRVTNIR